MAQKELRLHAFSTTSPATVEATSATLDRIKTPNSHANLLVLPEYFLNNNGFDGIPLTDPRIGTLENFAKDRRMHIVAGTVMEKENKKTLTALFITPEKGITGKYDKRNPTPFESKSGIVSGTNEYQVFPMEGVDAKVTIVSCWDLWREDLEFRKWMKDQDTQAPEIIAHVRGFDLNDTRFGIFTKSWLAHFSDVSRMTKSYGLAATGVVQPNSGSMSEIVNFEGELINYDAQGDRPIAGKVDLDRQKKYRRGEYTSPLVPQF